MKGSSSYTNGDTGGSCGDYDATMTEHGVSSAWIRKRVRRGMKKASPHRQREFASKAAGKQIQMDDWAGGRKNARMYEKWKAARGGYDQFPPQGKKNTRRLKY